MSTAKQQLEALKDELRTETAAEVKTLLDNAQHNPKPGDLRSNNPWLDAKLLSALFMTLRDELVSAYYRVEEIQEDRMILTQRMNENSFRNEYEAQQAERTLSFYETLDERLSEVIDLISAVKDAYDDVTEIHNAQEAKRLRDTPPEDRRPIVLPPLRWASNAERQNPNWEDANDLARLKKQLEFLIN